MTNLHKANESDVEIACVLFVDNFLLLLSLTKNYCKYLQVLGSSTSSTYSVRE